VERAIRFGLAVNGKHADNICRRSVFARKNYFYPDLPKGYQISQYELPIVSGGSISIVTPSGEKTIRLTRAHLEEDAGKSLHEDFHGLSGIDLNRAGTPLLEIVSEPDMRSAEEAVAYAKAMHALVRWIGICDGNMQEGSFRCDANVSVRRPGAPLGTRREIKNLNSFRFLQQAIEYEVQWQIDTLEGGGKIRQAIITKQMKFLKLWGTDGTIFRNRGVSETVPQYMAYLAPHYYHPTNPAPNGLRDLSKVRGVEVQLCMNEMIDHSGKVIKTRTFVTRVYSRVLNSKFEN